MVNKPVQYLGYNARIRCV